MTSVLSQNIPEFEIILINDNYSDNSSIIVNQMIKYDKRIIINNSKNMGTLFSRNIGVLNAKGKYIFELDNDDIFLNENIFNNYISN